jgi:hypothetical protein
MLNASDMTSKRAATKATRDAAALRVVPDTRHVE